MREEKEYFLSYWNGDYFGETTFYSASRKGSAKNKEDARNHLIRQFGKSGANYEISYIGRN